jgi:polyhydroxyalkanoate synthesis regulator phasin
MEAKQRGPLEAEQLKHILLEAYQRGEMAAQMTAKDMVQELVERLKHIFKNHDS